MAKMATVPRCTDCGNPSSHSSLDNCRHSIDVRQIVPRRPSERRPYYRLSQVFHEDGLHVGSIFASSQLFHHTQIKNSISLRSKLLWRILGHRRWISCLSVITDWGPKSAKAGSRKAISYRLQSHWLDGNLQSACQPDVPWVHATGLTCRCAHFWQFTARIGVLVHRARRFSCWTRSNRRDYYRAIAPDWGEVYRLCCLFCLRRGDNNESYMYIPI